MSSRSSGRASSAWIARPGASCASRPSPGRARTPIRHWGGGAGSRRPSLGTSATRERYGPAWATKFRQTWGAGLAEKFDVHFLLSTYAQAPTKLYVAGLFYPPKAAEDPHEHAHHVEHRQHAG